MSQPVALIVFGALIAGLFARDIWRKTAVSSASWVVLIWVVIFASRPVSQWFDATMFTPEEYLEGSPTDRAAFLVLILAGCFVLAWRRISIGATLRRNRWLFAFYAYCLVSVLWSDYPFVAFKRWFKDFGNVIMILVLLTERDPVEAIKTIFVRCAALLVPLSVMFIKYYPELGRTYAGYFQNERMYVGVATHKNTLGAILLVSIVFLVWDLVGRRRGRQPGASRLGWIDTSLILSMSLWLLLISNSATSLVCAILGVSIFLGTGIAGVRRRLRFIEVYGLVTAGVWLLVDSTFNVTELIVSSLGRDMTLTSRTGIWSLVLNEQINPVIGAGFSTFWTGDRLARLWVNLPGITQAHNGYLETYLNVGVLGVLFLAAMLLSGFQKIKRRLVIGMEFPRVQLAFWFVALAYNYSEASFNSLSLLWIVTLLVIAEAPRLSPSRLVGRPSTVSARREGWRPRTAEEPGQSRDQRTRGLAR